MNHTRDVLLAAPLFVIIISGTASAHEVGGRFTAPIPLELLFGGAAVTVAITALLLAFTVNEPPTDPTGLSVGRVSPSVATGARVASRGLFFIAFVLVIVIGFLGKQVQAENFATIFLWPVWLKGVAIVSALIGSPWAVLSPWKTLYDGLVHLEGEPIAVLGEYPSWLDVWPALGGFLIWIGILENLTVAPRSPRLTALLITSYTVVMLVGGLAFGPQWFRRADALAVLYRLFGRVAPITLESTTSGGCRMDLRWPWLGCLYSVSSIAVAAFVIATVYTVSFDGFTSTPEFQILLFGVREALGVGRSVSVLLYLLGFSGFVAVFISVSRLTQRLAGAQQVEWAVAVFAFAPTVLPIAAAYEIAHNYPFVLGNAGQLVAVLWSFMGLGHGPSVDLLAWLSLSAYWWSQVLLIVVGHIVAVIAAHYVAMARYPTVTAARRGHVPLTLLMIGYTVLSLWIVSRPIVTG
ncbi:hypothetical protein ACFQPA_16135 [Halomarina halobia]|uniref:Fenitrothion hydrolase n=1 Tax=Halomarina halobia TaxID=3033386 RepID=A0ABD6AE49_9EURY|nr:hypothetical protein [Halomarina sp. PSR21]